MQAFRFLAAPSLFGIVVIGVLLAQGMVAHSQARAATPSQYLLCELVLGSLEGTIHCYPPTQVRFAEAQSPVPVVPPQRVVPRITGLHLTLVSVFTYVTHDTGYLFGRVSTNAHGLPNTESSRTPFMVVRETVGHEPRPGLFVTRSVRHTAGGNLPRPITTYGPWEVSANFPTRNLSLYVESPLPRREVVRTAIAILDSASAGK